MRHPRWRAFPNAPTASGSSWNPQEEKLRTLLRQEGAGLRAMSRAGLIFLAPRSAPIRGSQRRRGPRSCWRHELSHGEFFSDPAYAEFVHDFWAQQLTETERAGMRAFLGSAKSMTSAMKS